MINKSAKKLKTKECGQHRRRGQMSTGRGHVGSTMRFLLHFTPFKSWDKNISLLFRLCSVNYIAKEFQNKFCRLRKRALYHAASCPLKEKAQFKTCYDKHMLLAIQTTRKNNWERVNKVSFGKQPILAGVWRKVPVVFSSVRPKKNRNCIKVGETRNCALIIILWLKWKHRISHLSSFDRSMLKKGQIISISHHYFLHEKAKHTFSHFEIYT